MGRCMCGADDCRACRGEAAASNIFCDCGYEFSYFQLVRDRGKWVPVEECPICLDDDADDDA